jgi:hypothetical protein
VRVGPGTLELALLQNPQKLRLQFERLFADLFEKNRPLTFEAGCFGRYRELAVSAGGEQTQK